MKFAAVVILYHPCEKTLANINSYYEHVDKVYVFDNTEEGSELKYNLSLLPKISYHHDGQNKGIASRLNAAARMALDDGFDWLLMMDQDSGFATPTMEHYLTCVRHNQFHNEVAMFGVNFEAQVQTAESPCNAVFSNELITSGTLLNLPLFLAIGFFDENLFIDGVDHEYTIRTLLAGYKIMKFPHIQLNHEIGAPVKKASFLTLYLVKKEKRLHSPLRCYYVYRNNLYLQKKYKNTDVVDMAMLNQISRSIVKNAFFYGRNPMQLLRHIFSAKSDFKNNKMGKYSKR